MRPDGVGISTLTLKISSPNICKDYKEGSVALTQRTLCVDLNAGD